MNKLIFTLMLSLTVAGLWSQEKADILVSYNETVRDWYNDKPRTIRMDLLANSRTSKYFNEITLWNDSLSSTPEGKRQLDEIIMAACVEKAPDGSILSIDLSKGPIGQSKTYVFNYLDDWNLIYYSTFAGERGFYSEPIDEIDWEIGDSTKNILGYSCNVATTEYHGRKWTAWFAPDLPLPFGPWKLRGLPGLILQAESDNGASFVADGLQKTDRIITPIYSSDSYYKVQRKNALADHEYYDTHREEIEKATNPNFKIKSNSNDEVKYDALKYALEPDYKNH